MTDEELEALLNDIESDRAERTRSRDNGDKFREAVCAFANDLPNHDQPGILFLASLRDDGNILPFPSMDVQKRRLKGSEVAVVIVHPSTSPPVRFRGVVCIRSGPRRGIANPDDERRLAEKRRFRDLPADIRPVESAGLDAIDELLFRRTYLPTAVASEVIEQNQRSLEHQLVAARFAHPGPPVRPTALGILTAGKTPTDWLPCAYVQFVRFDGTTLSDPVKNQREIRGPLPDLLREADDLLKTNIQTSADFTTSAIEVRKPDYPVVALQQILRNAILHRSYENTNAPIRLYWFNDRVEVQNPGGPYGQVTRENFGQPGANDYRNPNLAAVMKELGYVQRFGVGIALARSEMQKNGNPEPVFEVEESHIAVILRRRS